MSGRRPSPYLALAILLVTVAAVLLSGVQLRRRTLGIDYGHAARSIEMAFNWTKCGQFSTIHRQGFAESLLKNAPIYSLPLTSLVADRWGSVEAYCADPGQLLVLEDSGMVFVNAFLLRLMPAASVHTLFAGFALIMLLCLLLSAWALVRAGISLLVIVGSLFFGIALVGIETGVSYMSNHVFMWPPLFVVLTGFGAVGFAAVKAHAIRSAVVLLGLGAVAGFTISLRYSYLPYLVILFGLYAVRLSVQARHDGGTDRRRHAVRVLAAVACFVLGVAISYAALIHPLQELVPEGRATHPVFHPLVLGLAVPQNSFAKSEHLEWDDNTAVMLVRRILGRPAASYQEYEGTLQKYYVGLWQTRPLEMLAIYLRKAHAAGVGNVRFLARMGIGLVSPFLLCISGYLIMALLVAIGVHAWIRPQLRWSGQSYLVLSTCLIGLLAWLQSVIIFPTYSHFFPEFFFALILLTLQFWTVLGRWWLAINAELIDASY